MTVVFPGRSPRLLLVLAVTTALGGAGCNRTGEAETHRRPALIPAIFSAPAQTRFSDGEVDQALAVLNAAPLVGLPGVDTGLISQLSASRDAGDLARRDQMLTEALSAYSAAAHGQRIPTSAFLPAWGVKPAPYDAVGSLQAAIGAHEVSSWLAAQEPQSAAYKALTEASKDYRDIAARGGWPAVPAGPVLKVGAQGARVDTLRRRLRLEGYRAPAGAGLPFDPALAAAVGDFQSLHGLTPSGAVDAATLAELNVSALARVDQLRANLERLRWLPLAEPATRIDVNTAAAVLEFFVDGAPAMRMRVAAGRPGDETPMLVSSIHSVVLNPPWNVPTTIAAKELYPKEAANPGYLAAHGFETVDGPGGARLVQTASDKSALGLVKFDFNNPYSVYLHDTPSKAAFGRDQRAVSHGCVRLEQALALAKAVLSVNRDWPEARIEQALASGETVRASLGRRVPVRLIYLTAYPSGGRVAFHKDAYGWDGQVLERLDHPDRISPAAGGRNSRPATASPEVLEDEEAHAPVYRSPPAPADPGAITPTVVAAEPAPLLVPPPQ